MLKTQEEIINKIKNGGDIFGFTAGVLVGFLEAENAKELYELDMDFADWKPESQDRKKIIKRMREYMSFAWEKAIDERGLSANRSVIKFRAWLWMLNDSELLEFLDDSDNYPQYGKPMLAKVSEKYGFDVPDEAYPLDETANY